MAKKTQVSSFQLRGKVLAYNISPKGRIEGVVLETDGGLSQLNFAKHGADERTMTVGSTIEVTVELEHDHGDHPVYAPSDADGQAEGTIVRMNYALHGDINGYHLDNGTFVHVGPHEAKRYALRVGAKITATGSRRFGASAVVLDADTIETLDQRLSANA